MNLIWLVAETSMLATPTWAQGNHKSGAENHPDTVSPVARSSCFSTSTSRSWESQVQLIAQLKRSATGLGDQHIIHMISDPIRTQVWKCADFGRRSSSSSRKVENWTHVFVWNTWLPTLEADETVRIIKYENVIMVWICTGTLLGRHQMREDISGTKCQERWWRLMGWWW
jgi:hypothetical protein